MYKTITLNDDEIARCINFSNESASTQHAIEFG